MRRKVMLAVGEIRTCLLQNSTSLPRESVEDLLTLASGRRPLVVERPMVRAVSPGISVGVDCKLAVIPHVKVRGIGTVSSQAIVTGGTVLQGSTMTRLRRVSGDRREKWSYYAKRRQMIDVMGQVADDALVCGFLDGGIRDEVLDLGAICGRLLERVQQRPQLNYQVPFTARETTVRWAARIGVGEVACARVRQRDAVTQIVELTAGEEQCESVARFCEDFALHDWLLTALRQVIGAAERTKAARHEYDSVLLGYAVERLLHMWMPGAHVDQGLRPLWDGLEKKPGFSLQWNAQVAHVRDQLALCMLEELRGTRSRAPRVA